MRCNALNGHKGDLPKAGIQMVVVFLRFWMVLDHFIITVMASEEKIRSPLHNCLVGSKEALLWGNKFESLRKEKKQKAYRA